jgi:hypothetical protein
MLTSKAARHEAKSKPFFRCPKCEALYHNVKVEAGPQSIDHEITCCTCGRPLLGREGKFVMKYSCWGKLAVSENGKGPDLPSRRLLQWYVASQSSLRRRSFQYSSPCKSGNGSRATSRRAARRSRYSKYGHCRRLSISLSRLLSLRVRVG